MGEQKRKDKSKISSCCITIGSVVKWFWDGFQIWNVKFWFSFFFKKKIITNSNHTEKTWIIPFSLPKISIVCLCSSDRNETIDRVSLLSKFLVCNASIAFQWREKELLYSYNHLKELPHFQRFLTSHYRSTNISSILQAVSGVIWIAMIHNFSHRLFDKVKWKTNPSLVSLDLLFSQSIKKSSHYHVEPLGVTKDKACIH